MKQTKILVHVKGKACRLVHSNICAKIKFSSKFFIKLVSIHIPAQICHFGGVSWLQSEKNSIGTLQYNTVNFVSVLATFCQMYTLHLELNASAGHLVTLRSSFYIAGCNWSTIP